MLGPPGHRFMAIRGTDESRWRLNYVTVDGHTLNMTLCYQESFDHMWQVAEYVEKETR